MAKGNLTRQTILDAARHLYNEKGLNITLDTLASEMGVTKGRITNHFPTKEKLILAILQEYEVRLNQLRTDLESLSLVPKLDALVEVISRFMDLQYHYRCSMIYLNISSVGDTDIRKHVVESFRKRKQEIRSRMELLVKHKLLKEELLEQENFEAFLFVYVNQMGQWVVYHDMYSPDQSLAKMKPVYLRGIMNHVYMPYLTAKGLKELKQLAL